MKNREKGRVIGLSEDTLLDEITKKELSMLDWSQIDKAFKRQVREFRRSLLTPTLSQKQCQEEFSRMVTKKKNIPKLSAKDPKQYKSMKLILTRDELTELMFW